MSTVDEQTRAVVWAGGFLVQVAKDESLPLALRQRAVIIARHFPTVSEALLGGRFNRASDADASQDDHSTSAEEQSWIKDCAAGPLTFDTNLKWPE